MTSYAAPTSSGVSGFSPSAAAPAASSPSPRLVKAAHEFEAQMMKELLQPLHHGISLSGADADSDGDDSGSNGALGEFASEALGKALSEGGGFGIATSIVKQLAHAGNQHAAAQVTNNLHGDTVMSRHK